MKVLLKEIEIIKDRIKRLERCCGINNSIEETKTYLQDSNYSDGYIYIRYKGEDGLIQEKSIDIRELINYPAIFKQYEHLCLLGQPVFTGNTLTLKFIGEDGIEQTKNVNLSGLSTVDVHVSGASYNASNNIITITQNDGTSYMIDLSEFQILFNSNSDGTYSINQEGVEKFRLAKVAITGSYNDLKDKPMSYKSWAAFVTQQAQSNPVAIVLENTIGNITLTRVSTGTYNITSNNLFTVDKTVPIDDIMSDANKNIYKMTRIDSNVIRLETYRFPNTTVLSDDVLNKRYINIVVY